MMSVGCVPFEFWCCLWWSGLLWQSEIIVLLLILVSGSYVCISNPSSSQSWDQFMLANCSLQMLVRSQKVWWKIKKIPTRLFLDGGNDQPRWFRSIMLCPCALVAEAMCYYCIPMCQSSSCIGKENAGYDDLWVIPDIWCLRQPIELISSYLAECLALPDLW